MCSSRTSFTKQPWEFSCISRLSHSHNGITQKDTAIPLAVVGVGAMPGSQLGGYVAGQPQRLAWSALAPAPQFRGAGTAARRDRISSVDQFNRLRRSPLKLRSKGWVGADNDLGMRAEPLYRKPLRNDPSRTASFLT